MYKQEHFHFVGINGIGMSAIAKILQKQGHIISGCDLACNPENVHELIQNGCIVSQQHNSQICQHPSVTQVVYSSDVPFDAPELVHARQRNIPTVQRAAVLAQIMQHKKYSIGIAGAHGKTTTTAMIGHILTIANYQPTIIIGGIMHNINNNAQHGNSDYIVAETDESDRSFLMLPVNIGIVTNVDFEHVNTYKNLGEIKLAFTQFMQQIPAQGKLIACIDNEHIQQICNQNSFTAQLTTYGMSQKANFQITNVALQPDSTSFDIIINHQSDRSILHNFTIHVPGIYNVLNAAAAIATTLQLGVSYETIQTALQSFQGVDRRFTLKGIMRNPKVTIYDDYGHHPTEIYHSLLAARRKTNNKLVVVFQPQRYTRTFHLWNEFINVLANADVDHLIITDIYAANEPAIENITSQNLVQAVLAKNPACKIQYVPFQTELHDIKHAVLQTIAENDLLLLLGAGKVNKLAEKLL